MAERRPLPGWPRGMMEDLAASYIGLSPGLFRREWSAEPPRAPRPVQLTKGRQVWLREDLDAYLDRLAGRTQAGADLPPAIGPEAEWDMVCGGAGASTVS